MQFCALSSVIFLTPKGFAMILWSIISTFLGQCHLLHNFDFCKSSKLWKKRKDSHFGKMSSRRRLLRPFSSSIVRTPPFPLLNFLLLVIKLIVTVLEDRDFILGFILLTVAKMLAFPLNECKLATYWSAIEVKDITDIGVSCWCMLFVSRKWYWTLKLFYIGKFWVLISNVILGSHHL